MFVYTAEIRQSLLFTLLIFLPCEVQKGLGETSDGIILLPSHLLTYLANEEDSGVALT